MDDEVGRTLRHLRQLEDARREAGRERAARLRAKLPDAADVLRRHGATGIFVFGSLLEDGRSPGDVDLGVRGLAPEHYFQALADLMDVFGGPVDLVRLEDAPPSLRQRVEDEGRPL